ncbi:MAG: hydroxymethylbilane synthase [Lachnospiraceae bacterium]|nr:hydroxymethylbilane synthase [Lachnospiraceae bacterium]
MIRIGTRGSALALRQAELVRQAIEQCDKSVRTEIVTIRTKGDRILDVPLTDFGGKGAFVEEFEQALLDKSIDVAVHSAKDMPMELAGGLAISAVLKREDARDVLLTRRGEDLSGRDKICIGTSSLRRQEQIKRLLPAECETLRGNVTTRIEKLKAGQYDGILLAAAGLWRLTLTEDETLDYRFLSFDEMIPAGGQGIIAIEARSTDEKLKMLLASVNDGKAMRELQIERYMLRALDAGCHEPIGVLSQVEELQTHIRLFTARDQVFAGDIVGRTDAWQQLADELIAKSRSEKGQNGKISVQRCSDEKRSAGQ